MQTDCYLCGSCRERNKNYTGLNIKDEEWLEEMNDMIEAVVEGIRKKQSFSADCFGREFRG